MDDATRRQLRFSLFLQGFAALMITITLVVRIVNGLYDLWTWIFLLVLIGVVLLFLVTINKIRG